MRKLVLSLAAAVASAQAVPATAAVTLVDTSCNLTTGCLFDGQITDQPARVAELEAAYNNFHVEPPLPTTISLAGLYKTSGDLGTQSGTFTLPGGGLFTFYAVKAGNQFMLYQVAPTNFVNWTTAGLVNDNGQLRDASHIVAFSSVSAVPEPATWAIMIVGIGLVGGAIRRRKSTCRVRVAYT